MSESIDAYFPLFIDLNRKKILVFGGGQIATRRIHTLLEFGPDITVIAPEFTDDIAGLASQKMLVLEKRSYLSGEVTEPYMVLAATNNCKINDDIYNECKAKGILVNVASDQKKSDFFFPGIVIDKPLVVGITASGKDHKKVKALTLKIKDLLIGERDR